MFRNVFFFPECFPCKKQAPATNQPTFSRPNSNESPKSKAGATTKTGGKGKGATPLGYYAIAYSPHADFAGPCLVTTWAEAAELTQGQRTAIHKKCPYTPVGQEAAEAWLDFG